MPAYSFKCNKCGEEFTLRVSISEKGNVLCPKCESKDLKQIFKSIGIIGGNSFSGCGNNGACGNGGGFS